MAARPFSETHPRSRPPSELTAKFERLLCRYPDVEEADLAAMIKAYPYLRVLDIGLITADDHLVDKLEAFHRDHARAIKAPFTALLLLFICSAVLAVVIGWV